MNAVDAGMWIIALAIVCAMLFVLTMTVDPKGDGSGVDNRPLPTPWQEG